MIAMDPIGFVESGFKEKFGVPKQSQMNNIESLIKIDSQIPMESFSGLESMSHVWVIFQFHLNKESTSAKVRPPLLGGNEKVGIYSSRSSFRHNNLGLSLAKLNRIDFGERALYLSGLDCVDQTPVLDIKPFHPVSDIPRGDQQFGWIEKTLTSNKINVIFQIEVEEKLKEEICQILSLDPRPAYQNVNERIYGMYYKNYNLKWIIEDNKVVVIQLEKI